MQVQIYLMRRPLDLPQLRLRGVCLVEVRRHQWYPRLPRHRRRAQALNLAAGICFHPPHRHQYKVPLALVPVLVLPSPQQQRPPLQRSPLQASLRHRPPGPALQQQQQW